MPRTSGALGYTMQVDEGNHYLMSKEELENKIATLTGGRAAEEVVFGSITTGASNDIEQATKLARAMITRYGMSEDFDMVALETVTNQYLGGDTSLACSAETQREIDQQVVDAGQGSSTKRPCRSCTENRGQAGRAGQVPAMKRRPSPARSSWTSSTAVVPKTRQKLPPKIKTKRIIFRNNLGRLYPYYSSRYGGDSIVDAPCS